MVVQPRRVVTLHVAVRFESRLAAAVVAQAEALTPCSSAARTRRAQKAPRTDLVISREVFCVCLWIGKPQ